MSYLDTQVDGLLREAGVADEVIEEFRFPWAAEPKPKRRPRAPKPSVAAPAPPQRVARSGYNHLGPAGRPRNVSAMSKEKLQHLAAHPESTDELRRMVRHELRGRGAHVPKIREAAYIEAWSPMMEAKRDRPLKYWKPGDDVDVRSLHTRELMRGWRHHTHRAREHRAIARTMVTIGNRDNELFHKGEAERHRQRALRMHSEFARRTGRGLEVATGRGDDMFEARHGMTVDPYRRNPDAPDPAWPRAKKARHYRIRAEHHRRLGDLGRADRLSQMAARLSEGELTEGALVEARHRSRGRVARQRPVPMPSGSGVYRHAQKGGFMPARSRQNPMRVGSIVGFRHPYDKHYGIKGYRLGRVTRSSGSWDGTVELRTPEGKLHELESKHVVAVVPKHRESEALDAVEAARGLHNIHNGFMGRAEKARRGQRRQSDAGVVSDYVRRALGSEDMEYPA